MNASNRDSTVTFKGAADISTDGAAAHAVYTNGTNSNVYFGSSTTLNTKASDAYSLYANYGKISGTGKFLIGTESGREGIYANRGTVDLKMKNGSVFNGYTSKAANGTVNIDLSDSSTWRLTDSSTLTHLGMDTSSTVIFTVSGQDDFTTVTANEAFLSDGVIKLIIDGYDPVLGDIAGTGYAVNCITKNASRPDIIIKLFDYLWSDEGQMLCGYGLEGNADSNGNITALADADFASKFTVNDATWYRAANGEIKRTQSYLDLIKTEGVSDEQRENNQARLKELGLDEWQLFRRPQFFESLNTGKKQATKENAYVNNMKLPLTIYSTDAYMITGGLIDPTRSDYSDLVKIDNQMNTIWSQTVLSMIQAKSAAEVETIFQNGRKRLTSKGHDKLFDARAEVYAQKKESQGIAWGYPHRDPNYKNAVITQYYTWEKNGKSYTDIFGAVGDVSYYIDYELIG